MAGIHLDEEANRSAHAPANRSCVCRFLLEQPGGSVGEESVLTQRSNSIPRPSWVSAEYFDPREQITNNTVANELLVKARRPGFALSRF